MCKNDPKIRDLPTVLEDLVYMFAFNMPKEPVQESLNTILEVKQWGLPFWFLNDRIWSWHYRCYLDTPIKSFIPMQYYGGDFRDLFNLDVIYCFLLGLDFRMKNVRKFGSRQLWEARILDSWRCLDALSSFYKMLLRTKTRVLRKNTYYENYYVMGKPNRL